MNIIEKNVERVIEKLDNVPDITDKKVLITGGTGLIGLHLSWFFDKMGADVEVIFYNDIPEYFEPYLPCVDMIQFDLAKDQMNNDGTKFDYIVHSAGYSQPSKFLADPNSTIAINTTATMNLFKFLNPSGKFLFISSDAVYTGATEQIYTENMSGFVDLNDPRISYIESKRMGEVITKINGGVIARLSYVCGVGGKIGDNRVVNEFVQRAIVDKKLKISDGRAMRSWLPVTNATEMLLNVLFHGRNREVYNVANVEENTISILDLAKEICRLTDVPLEEKNQNSIVDKSAPQTMNLSISKYEKEFGICEFEKLSDVLKDVVDWYREISKKGNN